MLNPNWTPDDMDAVEAKWSKVAPPSTTITAQEAEQLMNQFLLAREDWAEQYTNALYYQEFCEYERDSKYRIAYFKSDGKSERAKDIQAKDYPAVQVAELQLIQAKTAMHRAKLKVESTTLAHHSMKTIYNKAQEELWTKSTGGWNNG